jgi:hypothetical protein
VNALGVKDIKNGIVKIFRIVKNSGELTKEKAVILVGNLVGIISENLKGYGQWLAHQIFGVGQKIVNGFLTANDFIKRKISQGFKTISQFFKKTEKIVEEKPIPKSPEKGLVVIPSSEKDEELKQKIKEAFSDEVRVEPKDEIQGLSSQFLKKEKVKNIFIFWCQLKIRDAPKG